MLRFLITSIALALVACTSQPAFAPTPPLVLTGEITRADHQTYREIAFTPPPGTGRISVDFAYTGKDQKTVIDIGLRDPEGQRGWSGGNKSHIEVGEFDATASYKPGRIQPGEWKLVLGIPNIRADQMATYTATITFAAARGVAKQEAPADLSKPPSTEAGWRRGDFHNHTAHSDGSCDVDGKRGPCPLFNTADAARDAGLDFVAITDHNTITQLADMRRLQASYPKTLLIPGTEVTTFSGHVNVIGNSDFVDFQLGSPRLPKLDKLFDEAAAQGAIVSVNHPGLPSGEICMGCGWTVKDTNWSRVTALEVVNGSTLRTAGADSPANGIHLWDDLLKQDFHITAIGGSDNHDATDRTGAKQSPVGTPATVVYAADLSRKSIIDGVKSGRVFVDVAGLPDARLDMQAYAGGAEVFMGGTLPVKEGRSGGPIMDVLVAGAPAGSQVAIVGLNMTHSEPRRAMPMPRYPGFTPMHFTAELAPGAAFGYLRPELRDASGKLLLLGNPIYFTRATSP
ncbi:MAG: CehA/McbA family metallohydrolase [Hyphomonadaceae bacterium]